MRAVTLGSKDITSERDATAQSQPPADWRVKFHGHMLVEDGVGRLLSCFLSVLSFKMMIGRNEHRVHSEPIILGQRVILSLLGMFTECGRE